MLRGSGAGVQQTIYHRHWGASPTFRGIFHAQTYWQGSTARTTAASSGNAGVDMITMNYVKDELRSRPELTNMPAVMIDAMARAILRVMGTGVAQNREALPRSLSAGLLIGWRLGTVRRIRHYRGGLRCRARTLSV